MTLIDPTKLEKWLRPHSMEWYEQLSKLQNKYMYPWMSTILEPNGELIFDNEATEMVVNQKVLDIGCGDGNFMNQLSCIVKEIVGFDITEKFIQLATISYKK
ncbi:methyltransferase domain-containing protein [Ornithinibacillus halotolerans]|uniref:Methyltransferase domain-containing protein n=1 Tax=Ornithinibacillus halotolerans TaxID=1274357 RepID=A0A916S6H3_9BACI|nr:class I SAM-dependent methyltransferase [Ornithinibacillus halotolerans]GGA86919.1 hypothetical protein GCM10008025_32260 [Ornithinibacillus halotolerans]